MHNIIIVVHTLKSSHMLHEGFQVCCKVVVFAKYHNTQKLPKLAKCETYVAVTGISYLQKPWSISEPRVQLHQIKSLE